MHYIGFTPHSIVSPLEDLRLGVVTQLGGHRRTMNQNRLSELEGTSLGELILTIAPDSKGAAFANLIGLGDEVNRANAASDRIAATIAHLVNPDSQLEETDRSGLGSLIMATRTSLTVKDLIGMCENEVASVHHFIYGPNYQKGGVKCDCASGGECNCGESCTCKTNEGSNAAEEGEPISAGPSAAELDEESTVSPFDNFGKALDKLLGISSIKGDDDHLLMTLARLSNLHRSLPGPMVLEHSDELNALLTGLDLKSDVSQQLVDFGKSHYPDATVWVEEGIAPGPTGRPQKVFMFCLTYANGERESIMVSVRMEPVLDLPEIQKQTATTK